MSTQPKTHKIHTCVSANDIRGFFVVAKCENGLASRALLAAVRRLDPCCYGYSSYDYAIRGIYIYFKDDSDYLAYKLATQVETSRALMVPEKHGLQFTSLLTDGQYASLQAK